MRNGYLWVWSCGAELGNDSLPSTTSSNNEDIERLDSTPALPQSQDLFRLLHRRELPQTLRVYLVHQLGIKPVVALLPSRCGILNQHNLTLFPSPAIRVPRVTDPEISRHPRGSADTAGN